MKISEIFALGKTQYELDFVDVDPDEDIPLFLDPYFISSGEYPLATEAHRTLKSYFDFLLMLLKEAELDAARELFSYLGESNEVCLGFSKGKPQGKGMGPTDADRIFKSLLGSRAIESGVMEEIEDFRIFVPNVDKDKMSDMTANIIRKVLIQYTQNQCDLLGIPMEKGIPTGYYWDIGTRSWKNEYDRMLVVNGRKILLVPKRFVSYAKDYTPQKYVDHFALNFLKNEQLRLNGPLVQYRKNKQRTPYVTKKSVREKEEETSPINKHWITMFTASHPTVFREFRKNAKNKKQIIDNAELVDLDLGGLCQYLSDRLKHISPGSEQASEYHKTVEGILELLFYPHLCSPVIENEIHEGRKRIDIVFDNCAEKGFFYRVPNVYNIPSSFVVIECKNYSRDIANPELDQIAGRFSVNRGKIGLIVCRSIEDKTLFLRRCQDTYNDQRGLIIPLTDDDLLMLLSAYPEHQYTAVDTYLQEAFHEIVMQ